MLDRYALIGLFGIAALTFPFAPLILAKLARPSKPTSRKQATYECGLEFEELPPEAQIVWVQFRVQYYIYALLFVLFDIEVVFLYPWAVATNAETPFWFVEMAIFLIILIGGLAYAWRKKLLEWV